jgi:hypothetical protein
MKTPNNVRFSNDTDNITYNSNTSGISLIEDEKNNNKTEQLKLRRNLLQTNYPIQNQEEASTPKAISENSSVINKNPEQPLIQLITFKEAYNYFQSSVLPSQSTGLNNGDSDCCSCESVKNKQQKNSILRLSRVKYDENNVIHFRILFTIYYYFTKRNCEKEGEHWQDIGFQSDTPGQDLISVGMFGPLQILYGIDTYPNFYSNLFQYLLMRKCDLFFAGNLISFSKFSLNILERGMLDNDDNNNLFIVLNEIYVGMGYDFYNNIQTYGNSNTLTIEFIVKTIQKISERRTEIAYFIGNHTRN